MVNKVTPDTMLSASRLPGIMGISRYQTPNDELEYSIRALKGEERRDIGNEAMAWGNIMEPLILEDAARRLELTDMVTDHPVARYHESLPLCCSLDGTADGRGQVISTDPAAGVYVIGQDSITLDGVGVLEAKLTAMPPDDVPPLWRGPIQLQAQMDIVQAKWGAVCTLYRGTELRVFVFAPHQATVKKIAEVATDFQRRLDEWKTTGLVDYYPPAEGEQWPDTRGVYPIIPVPAVLDDSCIERAEKILAKRKEIKKLQTDLDADEEKLKEILGKAEMGIAGQYQIIRSTRHYQAQPAKMVPAKEAYTIRQSTITIKPVKS